MTRNARSTRARTPVRAGNRITSAVGAATDTYTYPPASNRLSGINLSTGGTRAYTYDGAGNVLTDSRGAGYSYTYDLAGRMATMSINGVLQGSYRYDFAGRQAIRTIAATGVTIHSVFDSQGRRIAEYNQATGALIREYVWMGWQPVAVLEGGVTYLIRTDHIGRPVFATNTSGVKVWTVSYDPFSNVRTTTGTPIPARFPGQWFQAESGLHQNWMRDYDPTTGRYLQADPLGRVDGASVYGYVSANPVAKFDAMGLQEVGMNLGLTDGWQAGLGDTGLGDFATGFGSFWRGTYRCASGYCSDINEQRLKQYADYLRSNPDALKCLSQLLIEYAKNNPFSVIGRTAGGQSAGALSLFGTRGAARAARVGLSAEIGAGAQLASSVGDLGYYLDDDGNRDVVEAAFMFLYGNKAYNSSDAPCDCREILESYR